MSEHLIDDLPPLPEPAVIGENALGGDLNLYTAEQVHSVVHSVVLADRALRGDGMGDTMSQDELREWLARVFDAEPNRRLYGHEVAGLIRAGIGGTPLPSAALRSLGGKQ